jgi:hypothetical protein
MMRPGFTGTRGIVRERLTLAGARVAAGPASGNALSLMLPAFDMSHACQERTKNEME